MKGVLFGALLLSTACSHSLFERRPASRELCFEDGQGCPFFVIGHRGAPYEAAENTLPAFKEALKQGANALEIDLVMTKDEQVVLYHDRTPGEFIALLRQIGAEGQRYIPYNPGLGSDKRVPVEELTLSELREFYGYALSRGLLADTFTNNTKDESAVIPTLSEFSQWADREASLFAVFLDVKLVPGQEALALKMADEFSRAFARSPYRVYMMTAYDEIYSVLQEWVSQNPHAPNRYLTLDMEKPNVRERMHRLRSRLKTKVKSLGLGSTPLRSWDEYHAEVVDLLKGRSPASHKEIYPVVSWTIDDQKKLYELLQAGVDGVLTNRPARLRRLLERHWKDHSTITKSLAACLQKSPGEICTDGAKLDPLSSVTYQELRRWVCQEEHVHKNMRDLYGCGGILDKTNIKFEGAIEANAQQIIYRDLAGEVQLSKAMGEQEGEPFLLNFSQEKCFDGALNHRCEFALRVEVYQQGLWRKVRGEAKLENSFSQVIILPTGAKKLRVYLTELDDDSTSDQAILYLDPVQGENKKFMSPGKIFQGELGLSKLVDGRKRDASQDVILQFDEESCEDGFLNYRCEYTATVELYDSEARLMETHAAQGLTSSFQLFASWPESVTKIKVTLTEKDNQIDSGVVQAVMSLQHGETFEVQELGGVFKGTLKLLLIDYDEEQEHSEGRQDVKPHQHKAKASKGWLKILP